MKNSLPVCLILMTTLSSGAQKTKEFEGVVEYKISFHFKQPGLDTESIMSSYGTLNTFYYKEGNYRWESNSTRLDIEYFDARKQTVFFLFKNNDTLFQSQEGGYDDSLVQLKSLPDKKVICGLTCAGVATTIRSKDFGGAVTRRNLYFSPTITINPDYFRHYRTFASNKVYQQIKSWPLLIEINSENIPFTVIMEATKITPEKLELKDILPPTDKEIKKMDF